MRSRAVIMREIDNHKEVLSIIDEIVPKINSINTESKMSIMAATSDIDIMHNLLYISICEKWKGKGFDDFQSNMDISKKNLVDLALTINEGLEGILKERIAVEIRLEELELELTNVEMEESKSHQG